MVQILADLRNEMEAIRDQGRRPTCLAFATSGVHRWAHAHNVELCAEWLYYFAVRQDAGSIDGGATLTATREVLISKGQPDELFWPYTNQEPNRSTWCPPIGDPNVRTCESGSRLGNPDIWRKELESGVPIVVGIMISDVWALTPNFIGGEAVFPEDTDSLERANGHAVVLVGHGLVQGHPYFLVRNSWGLNWGWGGHGWISEKYLVRRFAGAFIIQKGANDDVQSDANSTYSGLRLG